MGVADKIVLVTSREAFSASAAALVGPRSRLDHILTKQFLSGLVGYDDPHMFHNPRFRGNFTPTASADARCVAVPEPAADDEPLQACRLFRTKAKESTWQAAA